MGSSGWRPFWTAAVLVVSAACHGTEHDVPTDFEPCDEWTETVTVPPHPKSNFNFILIKEVITSNLSKSNKLMKI